MSRNLTYSYASIDHDIKVVKSSGSVFSFPLLVNVSEEIRELVAEKVIETLHDFIEWLDEPPADWARLMANLPLLPSDTAHAQTRQKEDYFRYNGGPVRPQEAALSLSGSPA